MPALATLLAHPRYHRCRQDRNGWEFRCAPALDAGSETGIRRSGTASTGRCESAAGCYGVIDFRGGRGTAGLKLDAQQGPVDVLVIEHAERPAAGSPPATGGDLNEAGLVLVINPMRWATLLLAALPLLGGEQHGQVTFAGLPLPGASVTVTQGDKTLTAIADQQGNYSFADLPDGTWTFKVEMLCFSTITQELNVTSRTADSRVGLKLLPLTEIQAQAGPAAALSAAHAHNFAEPSAGHRTECKERREACQSSGRIYTRGRKCILCAARRPCCIERTGAPAKRDRTQ